MISEDKEPERTALADGIMFNRIRHRCSPTSLPAYRLHNEISDDEPSGEEFRAWILLL
jgi:hypothetical protein